MTGKLNRGLSVVDSYKLLKGDDDLNEEEMFLASTLGWCIEWVILFSPQCCSDENLNKPNLLP
jgi:farnesyl diphosphate synthase